MPDGPGCFGQGFSCPALLRVAPAPPRVARTGLSPPPARRSRRFRFPSGFAPGAPSYPGTAATAPVWASPLSLAATPGITLVFSSSGYLDVSVPRVRPRLPAGGTHPACRVPPFGHPRISGHLRLPAAFRSLSRPSSPPVAQASPVRPLLAPRPQPELPPRPHPAPTSSYSSIISSLSHHVNELSIKKWRISESNR